MTIQGWIELEANKYLNELNKRNPYAVSESGFVAGANLLLPRLLKAEELLSRFLLVHNEPCRTDHHGYCQSHFLEENCLVRETHLQIAEKKNGTLYD